VHRPGREIVGQRGGPNPRDAARSFFAGVFCPGLLAPLL
jgi:hypothetical protein